VDNEGQAFWLYPKLSGKVVAEYHAGDGEKRAGAFGRAIGFFGNDRLLWGSLYGVLGLRRHSEQRLGRIAACCR
jgi:hypothetical protein